jgi:hypothetical protein
MTVLMVRSKEKPESVPEVEAAVRAMFSDASIRSYQ